MNLDAVGASPSLVVPLLRPAAHHFLMMGAKLISCSQSKIPNVHVHLVAQSVVADQTRAHALLWTAAAITGLAVRRGAPVRRGVADGIERLDHVGELGLVDPAIRADLDDREELIELSCVRNAAARHVPQLVLAPTTARLALRLVIDLCY